MIDNTNSIKGLAAVQSPVLEMLDLAHNHLHHDDFGLLCSRKHMPHLKSLVLTAVLQLSYIGYAGPVQCFANMQHLKAANWPQLTQLVLSDCKVTDLHMDILVQCQWPMLQRLDVSTQVFLPWRHKMHFLKLSQNSWELMQVLDLSHSSVSVEGVST